MSTSESIVGIIIEAQNRASKKLKEVETSLGNLKTRSEKMKPVFKKMSVVGTVAFGALAVAVGSVIKTTADFNSQLANISTLMSGDSSKAVDKLKNGILKLSQTMPESAKDLGSSAYAIFSAGITDSAKAMDILKNSAKLATAGLGTTEEATTLMTLATNNFKKSNLSASQISDIMFKTVKNGITTVAQLSQSFGLVAPLAVNAGISLQELQAATSALTQVNKSASISQNSIKQALVSLGKPTKDATKLFGILNVKTFPELVKKSGGMVKAFQKMKDASHGNSIEFAGAIGSGEALSSVLALLGSQSQSFKDALKDMTTGTNAVNEAFKKQTKTFNKQFQLLKNNLMVALIKFGSVLLPLLTKALTLLNEKMLPIIKHFANFVKNNPKLVLTLVALALAFTGLVAVLGIIGLVLPAVISGFTLLGTIFSGILFASGVGIVVAGIILIANNLKDIIGDLYGVKLTWSDVWTGMKNVVAEISDFIVGKIEYITDSIKTLTSGNGLSGFLKNVKGGIGEVAGDIGNYIGVNDAIITPSGQIVKPASDDYIIATKDPSSLGGGSNFNFDFRNANILDKNSFMRDVTDAVSKSIGLSKEGVI